MKRTSTLALIALALAYLLGLQFVRYERAVAHQRSVVSTSPLSVPTPGKPSPAHAATPDRRLEFGGYPCQSDDCREDWAGYRWAESKGVADPDDCAGKTAAFIEGCRVYARQQKR